MSIRNLFSDLFNNKNDEKIDIDLHCPDHRPFSVVGTGQNAGDAGEGMEVHAGR